MEALYNLDVATELIPFPSKAALCMFLHRNRAEFTPLYRRTGGKGKYPGIEQRFLSESEILKIREMTMHGWEDSKYKKMVESRPRISRDNTPKIKVGSPLAGVLRRAYA